MLRARILLAVIALLVTGNVTRAGWFDAQSTASESLKQQWLAAEAVTDPVRAIPAWQNLLNTLPRDVVLEQGVTYHHAEQILFDRYRLAALQTHNLAYASQALELASSWPAIEQAWSHILLAYELAPVDADAAMRWLVQTAELLPQIPDIRQRNYLTHGLVMTALKKRGERPIFGSFGIALAEYWLPSIEAARHRAEAMQRLAAMRKAFCAQCTQTELQQIIAQPLDTTGRDNALLTHYHQARAENREEDAMDTLSALSDSKHAQKMLFDWARQAFSRKRQALVTRLAFRIEDGLYSSSLWGEMAVYYQKHGQLLRAQDAMERSRQGMEREYRPERRSQAEQTYAHYLQALQKTSATPLSQDEKLPDYYGRMSHRSDSFLTLKELMNKPLDTIAEEAILTALKKAAQSPKNSVDIRPAVNSSLGRALPDEQAYPAALYRPGWLRQHLPPVAPFQLAVIPSRSSPWLEEGFAASTQGNAIFLTQGTASLEQIYDHLQSQKRDSLLIRQGREYTLQAPLIIGPQATLTLDRSEVKTLTLSGEHKAMMINAGKLYISNITLQADAVQNFQPFLLGWSGSQTFIGNSRLRGLGYDAPKSYGITLSAGPSARLRAAIAEPPAPELYLLHSDLSDLFHGVYADQGRVTAIGNRLHHLRGHGIVLRNGTEHYLYGNLLSTNQGDGITLRNTSCSLIASNALDHHTGDGIRLRHSADTALFLNRVETSRSGIHAYEGSALTAVGNYLSHNKAGITAKNLSALFLRGNRMIDQPRLLAGDWFAESSYLVGQFDLSRQGITMNKACPSVNPPPCSFRMSGLFTGDTQSDLAERAASPRCQTEKKL